MGWKKQELVVGALEEIGYAAYVYDVQPEQLNSVLKTLDNMMATWGVTGIRIGYPVPSLAEGSSLDDDSKIPDWANIAVIANLAVIIAPRFGKTVQAETKRTAKSGYDALLTKAVFPGQVQFPDTLPLGQGNKTYRNSNSPYVRPPEETIDTGLDGIIDFT